MSARIAPDPVGSTAVASGDYRSRAADGTGTRGGSAAPSRQPAPPQNRAADILPPLPAPPSPPGTNFAAAVLAGALPPKPESPAEAFRRLGSAWRPPSSTFHLLDRVA